MNFAYEVQSTLLWVCPLDFCEYNFIRSKVVAPRIRHLILRQSPQDIINHLLSGQYLERERAEVSYMAFLDLSFSELLFKGNV